jgi:hypothetical protein
VRARSRSCLRRAAATLLLCTAARAAGAQGTAIVPLSDPAYADVDRLAALGALDSAIIGQRPYSRRELARIVRLAAARGPTNAAGDRLRAAPLRRLQARFGDAASDERRQPTAVLVDGAALSVGSTDAPRRGFSGSITRSLEATIGPLAERRLGTPAAPGQTAALELAHALAPTSWLAIQATERLEARAPRSDSLSHGTAELLLGGARARYRNVALQVGREQIAWAQHAGDGLFLASDAPALDLVSLASDAPFRLPWLLRVFGPTQATLVVADLGPSVVRSHSKLLAYKVSVLPRRSLELGATFMNHYGGEGGRAAGLGAQLVDFLPFVDIFRSHNYTDTTRALDVDSDKLLGVDGRWRVAALSGLVLTTELLIDDFDVHRMPTMFTWDGSQTFGAELPSLGAGSPLSLRVSAKHTGVRTYVHGTLSNGIATRGRLLGDELGPDAKSFGAEVGWHPDGPSRLTIEGRSAIYSSADYATDERGSSIRVRRVGPASNELRDRVIASVLSELRPGWVLAARAAAERVRNADFAGGRRRDYAADVTLRFVR